MADEITYPVLTGSVNFRDEEGNLWLAESWQQEDGTVSTTQTPVTE